MPASKATPIDAIVQSDQDLTTDVVRGLLRQLRSLRVRSELNNLDYKRDFTPTNESWLQLVKDVISMANYGGGLILFGVDPRSRRPGLAASLLATLDPTRISDQLRRYARTARVRLEYVEARTYGKLFGLLRIRADHMVVVCDTVANTVDASGRQHAVMHPGVIYTRAGSANAQASHVEIERILQREVEQRVTKLVAKVQQLATMPADAQLIIRRPDETSRAYVLAADGKGTPVTLVQEPDTAAISLREVLNPEVPFTSLESEVLTQVRLWRQGNHNHRADREALIRWYLQRDHLRVTDDIAEFALISACARWGYPMFWASKLSLAKLRQVVKEGLRGSYPENYNMVYVTAAMLWKERETILTDDSVALKADGRKRAQRLIGMQWEQFLKSGRSGSKRAHVGGETIECAEVLRGPRMGAEEIFVRLLALDMDQGLEASEKQFAYQLDTSLFARRPK